MILNADQEKTGDDIESSYETMHRSISTSHSLPSIHV